jgi:hypothetical protein
MTVSRRLVPGQIHAVTRRTLERRKFLNPRPGVRELVGYSLGRALEENPGVRLHTYVTSTTHPLCAAAHNGCYAELGVMRSELQDR